MSAHADLFVSNFTSLNGNGASGVWRNQTTSTDLSIPVELTQSGGTVRPNDQSSTQSRIDNSFPWQAIPFTTINAFSPNFDGDFINIQTQELATTTITLNFNAMVTNPVISFTDVEYRTTITFQHPFTVLASTSNLTTTPSGTALSSNRTMVIGDFGLFGEEAAGSIQFTGTFDQIIFTVAVAQGDAGVGNNDRTGYVVSTMTEPAPLAPATTPNLAIAYQTGNLMLSWEPGDFSAIQMSDASGEITENGWMTIPDLDPSAVGTWTGSMTTLGNKRFFRGILAR